MPLVAPRLPSLLLFFLASTALSPALAEVKAVTLTSSGLSEVIEGTDGKSDIQLTFTMDQVSDVLKSLTLLGPDVQSASLRIDSASATEQISKSLPFDPRRAGDLDHLISAFPGAEVDVALWDEQVSGFIVGIAPSCITPDNCDTLLVLKKHNGTLVRMPLATEMELTFKDPGIIEMISRGLDAVTRDASGKLRTLHVKIGGQLWPSEKETLISYVLPAPAWKTTWRAELQDDGSVDLQAWAIIENATGRDWTDVDLTLTTGSPRSLQTDLYASDWREREGLTGKDDLVRPVLFADDLQMRKSNDSAGAPGMMAMAEMSDLAPRVLQGESEAEARYAFEAPVSLKAGEVLSMPFLGENLEARRSSRYIGGMSGHPDFSLEIRNTGSVRLPAGIVTLQEAGRGYVGDAELPDIHPGETRSIAIGEDRKVSVAETAEFSSGEVELTLDAGVLTVEETNLRETVYQIEAAAQEPRHLEVDHPVLSGWSVEAVEGAEGGAQVVEDGQDFLRHAFDLTPGEKRTLRIVERQPVSSTWALADIGMEQLSFWKGVKMSEDAKKTLEEISVLRQETALLLKEREDLAAERAKLEGDQQRAIDLLQALPAEDPGADRFRQAMIEAEDRIAAIDAEDIDLRAKIEALELGLLQKDSDVE